MTAIDPKIERKIFLLIDIYYHATQKEKRAFPCGLSPMGLSSLDSIRITLFIFLV